MTCSMYSFTYSGNANSKKTLMVRYSTFVASLQIVTATCRSTVTGTRLLHGSFFKYGCNSVQSLINIALLICKLSIHRSSPNIPLLAASQYPVLLGLTHTLRITLLLQCATNKYILQFKNIQLCITHSYVHVKQL